MIARIIGLIVLSLCTNSAFTQIKGTIIDGETSQVIVGVYITSKSASTITDENGAFLLHNEAKQLIISHIGYHNDTLEDKAIQANLIITLKPITRELEQVNILSQFNELPLLQMPSNVGYIPDLNLPDLNNISLVQNLNMIPGIFAHSGTYSTNRITIRGIGSRTPYSTNRIKAYYNDIPLTSGDGTTEIEDLNSSAIGSIEVLKGSKSALYGSGIGGVIILNKPDYVNGIHTFAKTGIASYQTLQNDISLQYKQEGIYINGVLSIAQSEGWRQNNQYNRTNFTFNTGFSNDKNQIDFIFLLINTKAYIPSSINEQTFNNAPDSAAQNWLSVEGYESYSKMISGVTYKRTFSEKINNKTSLFAKSYEGYESRPFNILDDNAKHFGFRNITTLNVFDLKVQAGIESLFETYNWRIYKTLEGEQGDIKSCYSEKRYPLSVFFNGQYQTQSKLVLSGGVSLNTLSYELEDKYEDNLDLSGEYQYDLIFSPFIGANLPINKSYHIYSSISHGYSAPSVEETLLPQGMINPNLKPETGLNTEIGTRFKSIKNRFFTDVCLYSIWVDNLLATKRETEDIFYGVNAGKAWHRGLELNSSYQVNDMKSPYPVALNINYSLINATFTDYIDDGVQFTGNSLPGIPNHHVYILANIKSPQGIYLVPVYQFTGKQYMDDANEQSNTPFHLVHLKAGYTKMVKKLNVDITFAIKNVLNEHYASMILVNAPSFGGALPRYYYPGMPRNYALSVNLSF